MYHPSPGSDPSSEGMCSIPGFPAFLGKEVTPAGERSPLPNLATPRKQFHPGTAWEYLLLSRLPHVPS